MKTNQDVVKALMAMAVIYEKPLTEDAADMLLADLSGYPADKILDALTLCRKEIDRFPKVAEIIKRISQNNSSQTQATIGRIFAAISLYGYNNSDGARNHIGESGWKAVMYFGGWKSICDYPAENTMALRSQLGKAVEASANEDTRSEMLGLPMASGDDVMKPIENKSMKSLVFDMKDFR